MNLRMLNSVILFSSYPLLKVQTAVSDFSAYKYFTCLDFQQVFHQIGLPQKLHVLLLQCLISIVILHFFSGENVLHLNIKRNGQIS